MTKTGKKIGYVIGIAVIALLLVVAIVAYFLKPGGKSDPQSRTELPPSSLFATQAPESRSTPVSVGSKSTGDSKVSESDLSASGTGTSVLPTGTSSKSTAYDYNDLPAVMKGLPAKEALDALYVRLSGYWITDDYPFVHFFIDEKGAHCVEYGLFRTEFGMNGKVIDCSAIGPYEVELVVHFPSRPATETQEARPDSTETLYLDVSGLHFPPDPATHIASI